MELELRALSVAGVYGYLLCTGQQQFESRSWPTRYRGRTLIHVPTSKEWDDTFDSYGIDPRVAPKSSIIGAVTVVDCEILDDQKPRGDAFYRHIVTDPVLFKTPLLGVKGARSYWKPKTPEAVAAFEQARKLLGI